MAIADSEKRPGGITALAVINLVLAAFSALGILTLAGLLLFKDAFEGQGSEDVHVELDKAFGSAGTLDIVIHLGLSIVASALLGLSGIGLLRMAPVLGRWLCNAYALTSLVRIGVDLAVGFPLNAGVLLDLFYPALVLVLLNVTFRRDFAGGAARAADVGATADGEEHLSRPSSTALVTNFGLRHALRGGAAVLFVVVFLGSGFMIANLFISPLESMLKDSPRRAEAMLESEMASDTIGFITGADDATCDYFVKEQPAVLSAILLLLAALMPFFAGMAGFNQTAGEIGSRGLRFLLLRTDRRSLFIGRFLAALLFSSAGLVLLVLAVVSYMVLKLDIYPGIELVSWGAQGFIALWFVLLPHLAMMAWISALLDSALMAFTVGTAAVGLPVVLLKGVASAVETAGGASIAWLDRLQPWGWKFDLLSPSFGMRALAVFMMLLFTAAFLWLGLRSFQRRDV